MDDEAQNAVDLLYTLGVTGGPSNATFSPHADVNRRDMVRFLARLQSKVLDADVGFDLARLSRGSGDFADVS